MKKLSLITLKSFIYLNVLVLCLTLVNSIITQDHIRVNLEESFEHLDGLVYRPNRYAKDQSVEDSYADCISLNMIYYMEKGIENTLLCNYYDGYENFYYLDLETALEGETAPNQEYFRYWHGYMLFFRPLFCFFSIQQIKAIFFVVCNVLILLLGFVCYKKNLVKPYIFFIAGLVLLKYQYIYLALEYLSIWLVILLGCLFILKKPRDMYLYFLLMGISVAFFDFLTIETLGFTLPLLFYISMENKENRLVVIKDVVKWGVCYLLGYLCCFFYKYFIIYIKYGFDIFDNTVNKFKEKVISETKLLGGLKYNICLILDDLDYVDENFNLFLLVLVLSVLIIYFLRDRRKVQLYLTLLLIFTIPYARYFVLDSHSRVHCFFTYRAQLSSIFALLLCYANLDNPFIKKKRKYR